MKIAEDSAVVVCLPTLDDEFTIHLSCLLYRSETIVWHRGMGKVTVSFPKWTTGLVSSSLHHVARGVEYSKGNISELSRILRMYSSSLLLHVVVSTQS